MSKTLFFLAAVAFVAGAVHAFNPNYACIEKPCPRDYNPVVAFDVTMKCTSFPNLCFLENAMRCRRIVGEVTCAKGDCLNVGDSIPCPNAYN